MASLGAGWKNKGGMFNSSLRRFLDDWSDDDIVSKSGGPDESSHPETQEVNKGKISRADASSSAATTSKGAPTAVGPSKGQTSKVIRKKTPTGKGPARKQLIRPKRIYNFCLLHAFFV